MSLLARRALFTTASQCRRRMTTHTSKPKPQKVVKKTLEERKVDALTEIDKTLTFQLFILSLCLPVITIKC